MIWIDEHKEKPDNARNVLVCRLETGCPKISVAYYCEKEWWFSGSNGPVRCNVTHWMEIPKPPDFQDGKLHIDEIKTLFDEQNKVLERQNQILDRLDRALNHMGW